MTVSSNRRLLPFECHVYLNKKKINEKKFTVEETYLSVLCNNKNVYTQYVKIDSQRLHLASDIKQFLEHWKELEVVQ